MVSLGFLKFIFGFEIDVCISFVAHLIHTTIYITMNVRIHSAKEFFLMMYEYIRNKVGV